MPAADDCFVDAEPGCKQDTDRDRHVHVCPTMPQGHGCARKEGSPGVNDHRQGDQRGQPVEQFAGYTARTRPDADREQHDVHHAESRDGKRAQEHAAFGIVLA